MVKTRKSQEQHEFIIYGFVVTVVAAWIAHLVPSIVAIFRQISTNPNLSAYYTTLLYDLFLPLVVFGVLLVYRRGKEGIPLLVENVFLTLIVWLVATSVWAISQSILGLTQVALKGDLGWWYLTIVTCVVSVAAAAAVLGYARKLGKW